MPLQNRVTPSGDIVATQQRGMFTGNRGIIHDPATKTLLKKRWSTKTWITCVCEFRGWRRDVMAKRSWTELFFLDEATALASGHRPCFFCRRNDANRFRAAWEDGNGVARVKATDIDTTLHAERLDGKVKRLHALEGAIDALPDGAMLRSTDETKADACFLVIGGRPLLWSFDGYRDVTGRLDGVTLLTPPSTVRALRAGYRPALHPSVVEYS